MSENSMTSGSVDEHEVGLKERAVAEPVQDAKIRARVAGLVEEMSLDQKLSLVFTHFPYMAPEAEELGMTMSSGFNPGLPELGVPALRLNDAGLGVANVLNARPGDTATALPSALATGASFDPEFAWEGGVAIGGEARAKTFNVLLGGGINLTRDPWAGRNFEYLGEDPLLSGMLGAAAVRGIQSNHIACTLKHFILNAQETGRMTMDARIGVSALHESDLLAFEIAIEQAQPAAIMTAYNRINGIFAGEHDYLINQVLKGDWSFPGWVMSDWGAVHSTEQAALAGLDQESGIELDAMLNGDEFFTHRLREAVLDGRVPESRINNMVERILYGMICSGAMDNPLPITPQPIAAEENAEVAQRIAEAGIVLLRNEDNLLPLAKSLKRIAVIGGHADVGVLSGGGSTQVRSVGGVPIEVAPFNGDAALYCRMTYHASSPLRAIRDAAPQADVIFVSGNDCAEAARVAAGADVVIVFAMQWCSEFVDLQALALPDGQDSLIAAVAAANKRTIIVLETGGPVLMPWLDSTGAVLAAWYPGQRGGEAIARILFGEVNPGGRLPITFPASDNQAPRPLPGGLAEMLSRDAAKLAGDDKARIAPFAVDYVEGANVGYRWYEMTDREPLFEFGFGLSYTQFAYDELEVSAGDRPRVSVRVTNVGGVSGDDVPQVYVNAADSDGERTWRLAGFKRVRIAPGRSHKISIDLEPRTYSRWDAANRKWFRTEESFPLAVGRSARDLVLKGELTSCEGFSQDARSNP